MNICVRHLRRWAGILVASLALGGCGGGGGGGGGNATLLDVYAFSLGTTLAGLPLQVSFTDDAQNIFNLVFDLGQNGYRGTYDRTTLSWTVDAGSGISVNTDDGLPLFGVLSISVTSELQVPPDSPPTTGALQVNDGTNTILITVTTGGVNVSVNGGPATFFDWATFDGLFDNSGVQTQREASLAFQMGGFLLDEAFRTLAAIDLIGPGLEQTNPLVQICDEILAPLIPPGGLLNPGQSAFGWQDDSGDGSAGAGDAFFWQFIDCWHDVPNDDIDELTIGQLAFTNFTRVVNAQNFVTRIGFEPSGQVDGGVSYTDLIEAETVPDAGNNLMIEGDITVRGAMKVIFFAPN